MTDSDIDKTDLSALKIDRKGKREPIARGRYIRLFLWVSIPAIIIALFLIILSNLSPSVDVRTAKAITLTQSQSRQVLSATGYVVAQRAAAVASKATGRLEYLGVEEGDAVLKNQIIARIENEDMQAAVAIVRANLAQVRAESVQAGLEYQRNKQLLSSGSISKAQFELSEATFKSISAGVQSAKAAVKSAEIALENTYIRAPFDGTVLSKYADVGEIVAPMASSASSRAAVVVLADMKSLEVETDVSESNIQKLKPGQKCEIILDAYPDIRYKGYVKKIVPTADRAKATVLTKVAFSNMDDQVLPEMSARVNFLKPSEPTDSISRDLATAASTAVPNSAIVTRDGHKVIFAVEREHARQIQIETARVLGKLTEIRKGIKPGQTVILSPPSSLKDGDKVETIE